MTQELMEQANEMSTTEKWDWLVSYELFDDDELNLVCKGWGQNDDTINTICQVRFAMDFDQVYADVMREND